MLKFSGRLLSKDRAQVLQNVLGGVLEICQPKLSFTQFTQEGWESMKNGVHKPEQKTKSFTEPKFKARTDF